MDITRKIEKNGTKTDTIVLTDKEEMLVDDAIAVIVQVYKRDHPKCFLSDFIIENTRWAVLGCLRDEGTEGLRQRIDTLNNDLCKENLA